MDAFSSPSCKLATSILISLLENPEYPLSLGERKTIAYLLNELIEEVDCGLLPYGMWFSELPDWDVSQRQTADGRWMLCYQLKNNSFSCGEVSFPSKITDEEEMLAQIKAAEVVRTAMGLTRMGDGFKERLR